MTKAARGRGGIRQGEHGPHDPAPGDLFFRRLVDKLPTAAYTCDADGLIEYFNPQAESLWGRAPKLNDPADRYCGSYKLFGVDGSPIQHDQCWMAKALRRDASFNGREIVIQRPDGQKVHALAHANPIRDESGRLLGAVNVLVDLSERKLAQETVQQIVEAIAPTTGQDFFRALADHLSRACQVETALIGALEPASPELIHSIAVSHRGRAADNFSYDLRGTPCSDVVGKTFCYYPSDVSRQFPQDRLLNKMRVESYMGIPLFSSQGGTLGLIALMHDRPIVHPEQAKAILQVVAARAAAELERRQAEEALRASEQRYADLVNNLDGIVWEMNARTLRFRFVSPQAERILGYPVSRWLEEPGFWREHTHPEDREKVVELRLDCSRCRVGYELEYRMLAADGSEVWLHDLVSVETSGGEVRMLRGVSVDATERRRQEAQRRRLEDQMQHAQKLESLGLLAGGIAHDFNNLLTSMTGNAILALSRLPETSPAYPLIRKIEEAAQRSADLTRQMLAYSGQGEFVIEPIALDELVREMAQLLRTIVSKKAELALDLKPATIEADATQVCQIVMNLITNASDALGDNTGAIHLRTGVRHADAACLRSPFLPEQPPAGDYAYVEIEDSGCGIDKEALGRIFDPFFTTKFTGRGLGLAATLGIVRSHRGTIQVESRPSTGTVFRVLLPCAEGSARVAHPGHEGSLPLPAGQGTILIVEDEAEVRDLTRRILESTGFKICTAADGQLGLQAFERHRQDIVAVLLDLTMPRLDGMEVLRELRRSAPDVPVVVMSGYSEQEVAKRCVRIGAREFIQKPFRPRDLMARMCRVLAGSEGDQRHES